MPDIDIEILILMACYIWNAIPNFMTRCKIYIFFINGHDILSNYEGKFTNVMNLNRKESL